MKGDKLVIKAGHIKAAKQLMTLLLPLIEKTPQKFVFTVGGESGGGKSEIAAVLSDLLLKRDIQNIIFQQDDYFVYPPKTNAKKRRADINHVGLSEVRLKLLDQNLEDFLSGKTEITKPLVFFKKDQISVETVTLENIQVLIVEGTYTTLLKNVHQHVFVNLSYKETKGARLKRAREEQDLFLEKILKIEHEIISSHKPLADIVLNQDYKAMVQNGT